MTHDETSVLRSRLQLLADDLTPQLDVVAQVRTARERNRRQRRVRIAVLTVATAAAAVAVGIPVSLGGLNSSPAGNVAGPAGTGGDDDQRRSELEDSATERTDRIVQERLEGESAALAMALEAPGPGPTTVSLTAPAGSFRCPENSGAVTEALGVPLDYVSSSLPGDEGCQWTSGSTGPSVNFLSVEIGFNRSWTVADFANGVLLGAGCQETIMSSVTGRDLVLVACPGQGPITSWTLYVPDTSGTGVWMFVAGVGDGAPAGPGAVLAALVDVADRAW